MGIKQKGGGEKRGKNQKEEEEKGAKEEKEGQEEEVEKEDRRKRRKSLWSDQYISTVLLNTLCTLFHLILPHPVKQAFLPFYEQLAI